MKKFLKEKKIGFYFIVVEIVVTVISLIKFLLWAPNQSSMDATIIVALVLGIALNIIVSFRENNYLLIATTACYSVAFVKLLTNSIGSFVDLLQGINMFGDVSQIGSIISISITIGVSVLLSIVASFVGVTKEQN